MMISDIFLVQRRKKTVTTHRQYLHVYFDQIFFPTNTENLAKLHFSARARLIASSQLLQSKQAPNIKYQPFFDKNKMSTPGH